MPTDLRFTLYLFLSFIFGLIIGSFLNVVIHRVPLGQSIVFPGSHCPACKNPIGSFDNIPLLSYVMLRGRCRRCNKRISPIYPLVELLTALLFVAVVFKTGASWEALIRMAFACFMLALIFIDYRHQLLPNAITYPAFVFALAASAAIGGWGEQIVGTFDFSIIVPALESEFAPRRAAMIGGFLLAAAAPGFWLLDRLDLILFNKYFEWEEMNEEEEEIIEAPRRDRAIYGTMILGLLLAVLWAIAVVKLSPKNLLAYEGAYNGLLRASFGALIGGGLIWMLRAFHMYVRGFVGMGLGDVKMLSIIGAFLGWQGMFGVLLLASILGVIFGVIIKYRQKGEGRTAVPFGVCLGIASLVVMLR